jgi:alkylation response protein AidB-like acyl-CoA dehydrogenase
VVLDGGRIASRHGVGIAQACLDAALKYAKERQQFGGHRHVPGISSSWQTWP